MDKFNVADGANELFGKNAACAAKSIASNLGLSEYAKEAEDLSARYKDEKDQLVQSMQKEVDDTFDITSVYANKRESLNSMRSIVGIAAVIIFVVSALVDSSMAGSSVATVVKYVFYASLIAFIAMCVVVWIATGNIAKHEADYDNACESATKRLSELYATFTDEDIALSERALDAYLEGLGEDERKRTQSAWDADDQKRSSRKHREEQDPQKQAVRVQRRKLGRLKRRSEIARDLAKDENGKAAK